MCRDEETGESQIVKSTVGRFIFNEHIPQDLGFVDRSKDKFSLEIDRLVDKKMLGKIVDKCFRKHGNKIGRASCRERVSVRV